MAVVHFPGEGIERVVFLNDLQLDDRITYRCKDRFERLVLKVLNFVDGQPYVDVTSKRPDQHLCTAFLVGSLVGEREVEAGHVVEGYPVILHNDNGTKILARPWTDLQIERPSTVRAITTV